MYSTYGRYNPGSRIIYTNTQSNQSLFWVPLFRIIWTQSKIQNITTDQSKNMFVWQRPRQLIWIYLYFASVESSERYIMYLFMKTEYENAGYKSVEAKRGGQISHQ